MLEQLLQYKKCAFFLTNIFIIVIVTCTTVQSQIPYKLSFQGILTDTLGNSLADGEWGITFRLYDSHAGGNQLWTESKQIQTNRGLFSTILGDVNSLEGATRFDKPYWLSLQLSGQSEMLPRIQLTAVGYSLNSIRSDTARTVISIPYGIVTESKIANNTISSQKIVDGTISTADIANNSITTTKIASGQVVKSLNNLKDNIILSAEGGASITSSGDTIKINAGSGGGGTGIQGVQNTNNTLNITNPNGPTATINLKVPLTLSDSLQNTAFERGVFKTSNHGTGSAIYGVQTSSGKSIYGLNTGTGKAGVFSIENASNTQVALTGETNGSGRAIFANQTGTGRALHAQINNASNSQAALTGETNGSGSAIFANQSGTGMGLHAYINNAANIMPALRTETNGRGVAAYAYQTGTNMAGHFHINNTNNASTALRAETNGSNGRAAHFANTNSSNNRPVITAETNGTGYGLFIHKSGTGTAVDITNTSTNGRAGVFEIDNSSNAQDVLWAQSNGTGDAIQGHHSGGGTAVKGTCGSAAGRPAWFETTNTSNGNTAVVGITNGTGRAGYFDITNVGSSATALFAKTAGTGIAVRGDGGLRGVYGWGEIGVLGAASGFSSDNWGVFSNGDMGASGTKLAVVPIGVSDPKNRESIQNAKEWRGLYCLEATEVWFEDFGYGKLDKGEVHIYLDEIFSQTVNTKVPYHVFITPYGESKQLYVTHRTENSFKVVESDRGTSSIEFSYRIVAKRLGYENKRLEKRNPPGLSTIDEEIKETIIRDLPLDSNRNEQFR